MSRTSSLVMFLAILLLIPAPASPLEARSDTASRAVVRILSGEEISARDWSPEQDQKQKQIIHREVDGRVIVLRLTEFE